MSGERNGLEEREDQLRTGGDVRLVVPAAPEYLRLVRLTAAGLASRLGFTFDEVEDLRIAVDELCFHLLGDGDGDGGTATATTRPVPPAPWTSPTRPARTSSPSPARPA